MSKHTKEPWSYIRSSAAGRYIVSAENMPLDICVLSNRDKSAAEIQANARLIAAAPELLEALRQMVSIVAIHSRATKNNFAWAEMDEARAAIAKAGGGS